LICVIRNDWSTDLVGNALSAEPSAAANIFHRVTFDCTRFDASLVKVVACEQYKWKNIEFVNRLRQQFKFARRHIISYQIKRRQQ
jgi:hypothetical protein